MGAVRNMRVVKRPPVGGPKKELKQRLGLRSSLYQISAVSGAMAHLLITLRKW
jgi:hypothetical protein